MTLADGELWRVDVGDCRDLLRRMLAGCVQCCVTSTPYYGVRDYKVPPTDWPAVDYPTLGGVVAVPAMKCCLGLEPSPSAFVGHLVLVFAEVWRVLRDDGVVFLNLGDSYNSSPPGNKNPMSKSGLNGAQTSKRYRERLEETQQRQQEGRRLVSGVKPKDLLGIPWQVAFALRDAGWYLRSDVIWSKPNAMPESVTDRPTRAHEYLFLLTKRPRYYYDADAIREPAAESSIARWAQDVDAQAGSERANGGAKTNGTMKAVGGPRRSDKQRGHGRWHAGFNDRWDDMPRQEQMASGANKRSVWHLSPECFSGAHFAVMPTRLVAPCVLAGTSEYGECPACGSPWRRVVEREALKRDRPNDLTKRTGAAGTGNHVGNTVAGVSVQTVGWRPTCDCDAGDPVPQIVLDPFAGAGTVPMVARRLGRRAYGCELNPDYAALARRRVADDMPLFNGPPVPRPPEAP